MRAFAAAWRFVDCWAERGSFHAVGEASSSSSTASSASAASICASSRSAWRAWFFETGAGGGFGLPFATGFGAFARSLASRSSSARSSRTRTYSGQPPT
jgi:hypothetical protein